MNLQGAFTRKLWRQIGEDLRGQAWRWWKENEKSIIGMTKEEMHEIAVALKAKNVYRAQMAILSRLDPKDPEQWKIWTTFRDNTTRQLRAAAQRRVNMLRALEQLGRVAARIIGTAVLAAIGI